MNRYEILKKILEDFGFYDLANKLNLDYNQLKETTFRDEYNAKIGEKGLETLLIHKDLKNHILPLVFCLESDGLMRTHEYFINPPNKCYDNLLILLEKEEEINKIFKVSSSLMKNEEKEKSKYRNLFANFLAIVINKSNSEKNVKEMFNDFVEMKKTDKTDFFPIVKAFVDKNLSADIIYKSIKDLDNSYLETRFVEYLYQKGIKFSFQMPEVKIFETEENIIFEKVIKFNTNYFMKLGINEDKVLESLEKFSDLICNLEKVNYLIKSKNKEFKLTLRSNKELKIKDLYNQIKENSHLVTEFVQGFDDTHEYKQKFNTYWNLNIQFSPKKSNNKNKI